MDSVDLNHKTNIAPIYTHLSNFYDRFRAGSGQAHFRELAVSLGAAEVTAQNFKPSIAIPFELNN